ncbi:MAG: helix-turn-helix transcriptional regulator [Desulfobacterales bacterium]|jgi:transcriptional regulator with XRE-family HTH domain
MDLRERLDRRWTQQDPAKRLGVKQSNIAKWERKTPFIGEKPEKN